jgi:hypothetical protein
MDCRPCTAAEISDPPIKDQTVCPGYGIDKNICYGTGNLEVLYDLPKVLPVTATLNIDSHAGWIVTRARAYQEDGECYEWYQDNPP